MNIYCTDGFTWLSRLFLKKNHASIEYDHQTFEERLFVHPSVIIVLRCIILLPTVKTTELQSENWALKYRLTKTKILLGDVFM